MMIQRSMTLLYDRGRLKYMYISEPECGLHAFTLRILRRSHRLKMFLRPVQRLPLIKNLVELEKEAADNDVAKAVMLATQLNRRQGRRRMRRYWVRPWLERRPLLGQYERLMAELLRVEDVSAFRKFVRMDSKMFVGFFSGWVPD